MTERFTIEPVALSMLAASLKVDFDYLLNREMSYEVARAAIQAIAVMQEYSGNKVWRKS